MLLPQTRRFLFDDFDRLFGVPSTATSARANGSNNAEWVPALDVEENEEGLTLHVDLPGVPSEAIEVNVEDGVLVISGERNTEKKEKEGNYLRVERRHGKFERRLKLPEWADVSAITAKGKNGELRIQIPRAEKSKPRKIEIH